jgi:hypothetical protein
LVIRDPPVGKSALRGKFQGVLFFWLAGRGGRTNPTTFDHALTTLMAGIEEYEPQLVRLLSNR